MISTWKIHSSNISETLLKHVQTGSWNWLLCRKRAVGVWRIIPRIRTGLKPLDHQIGHHPGWTPSYRCTKPAWDFTICHYLRSEKNLAQVGRLTKLVRLVSRNLWELVEFVNRPSTGWERRKPLRSTTRDTSTNWRAGGRRRQRAYGNGKDGAACPVFGAANASILCVSLGFNVRENSSMFGWAWLYWESRNTIDYPYYSRTFKMFILAPRICHGLHDHRQHSEFRWIWMNLERRMTEWVGSKNMEKLWTYDWHWMTTVAGCFMSGCKNQRMRKPASDFANDSTQITATLEFIGATILIWKHVRICKHWFFTSFDYIYILQRSPKYRS